jgi:hypothetical protein
MARSIRYGQNNKDVHGLYAEGPFVVTILEMNIDCRVEVQLVGHHCPVLPDSSIYDLLKRSKKPSRGVFSEIVQTVNFLNARATLGQIRHAECGWKIV